MISQAADQVAASIELTAEMLRRSRNAVLLSGAGISTASGIPDFRSEGTGLWTRDEPLEVASLETFRTRPERFYQWFRPLAGQIFAANPNPAHLAVASLEKEGRLSRIITQNIDMLHQKAGSEQVIEVHGTLRTLACTCCYHKYDSLDYLPAYLETGQMPLCRLCGAILKPDVILFGEQLPQRAWHAAESACCQCDLIIVAGSSLEVLPVASLPMKALDNGAHLVIINQTPTYLHVRADVAILGDVTSLLPLIARQVLDA